MIYYFINYFINNIMYYFNCNFIYDLVDCVIYYIILYLYIRFKKILQFYSGALTDIYSNRIQKIFLH